jgi:regulator of RNase E activity RraA
VEINGPVQIGEVRVAAGDLVVADDTGVCFIPRDVVLERRRAGAGHCARDLRGE